MGGLSALPQKWARVELIDNKKNALAYLYITAVESFVALAGGEKLPLPSGVEIQKKNSATFWWTVSLPLSLSPSLSLSHTHTHTHSLSLSLSLTHPLSHTHTLSLSFSHNLKTKWNKNKGSVFFWRKQKKVLLWLIGSFIHLRVSWIYRYLQPVLPLQSA